MTRQGYIIVGNDHPLFPTSVAHAIADRFRDIVKLIKRNEKTKIEELKFKIESLSTGKNTPSKYVPELFSGPEAEFVRIVVTERRIPKTAIASNFPNSILTVTASHPADGINAVLPGYSDANRCHISVRTERVPRAIEDLFVDITLGNFFAAADGAISDLIAKEGHAGLFRKKSEYCWARRMNGWLPNKRNAGYALLSSLNKLEDEDLDGRAKAAFQAWVDFGRSLTVVRPLPTGRQLSRPGVESSTAEILSRLPKIGGQLPVRRIGEALRPLPRGRYILAILRKSSSVRKAEKTRGHIRAIFGNNARINSFVYYAADVYLHERLILERLRQNGFISVVEVIIGDDGEIAEVVR